MSFRYRLTALLAVVVVLGLAVPGGASERADTTGGVVYFLADDNGTEIVPGPRLVPVARTLDASIPATAAMQALLDGPKAREKRQGISSAIPKGTTLLGISISGGVATVDLSGRFDDGGGSFSMQARLAQVVWTLTQFSTVDSVKFEIDGKPTTVFGGEGVTVRNPSRPMDWESMLPAILVTRPAVGAPIANPVRITGYARTFESTFIAEVQTMRGRTLGRAVVTYGGADSGEYGWFDITLHYANHRPRNGIVKVWEISAQDGRPINVRAYRVRLAPGPKCDGAHATIVGTQGDDVLNGTNRSDVIVSLGGDDRINARDGDDRVCTGSGADSAFGGAGDDRLFGEDGDDHLVGSSGADVLVGGLGKDHTDGGTGTDSCEGEIRVSCP